MSGIKRIVGLNIRKIRTQKKISQEKLAELIDIGTAALSKIECGKSYPSPSTVEKIANILEIKPYILFFDHDDIDIDYAHKDLIKRLETLKSDKVLFKSVYDYVLSLMQ